MYKTHDIGEANLISGFEAWSVKERSKTGFSSESKEEAEKIQLWALDLPRMVGLKGLPGDMPSETRSRIESKISAEHTDLESRLFIFGPAVNASSNCARRAPYIVVMFH